jgi:hypothetical protein
MAPATGGMKWVRVVSTWTPRTFTGLPGVLKVIPEYASTMNPSTIKIIAKVFVFIKIVSNLID